MKTIGFLCSFLLFSYYVRGQSCDCPTATSCGSCAGGITSLTLRFNGSQPETITAADQQGVVFSQVVNPNTTFTFMGSLPNDKFVGANVILTVDGAADATIPSNCGSILTGNVYGSFTIAGALSKNGGPLCCSAAAVETTPPQITDCPTNITVPLPSSACEVAGGWTAPTATDNCNLGSFTSTHSPTDLLQTGVTTVTYTAVDLYNNSSTCTFTVTVVDNTAPLIANCPGDLVVEADGSCDGVGSWTPPTATDNCNLNSFTSTHSPTDLLQPGVTTVTYTAVDLYNNSSTCTFTVTVVDNTAPLITSCPGDFVVEAEGSCDAVVSWILPTATDNCSASLTASHEPGTLFSLGTTVVTYTAADNAENTTTCSFNVTVRTDDTPKVSGCPDDITVHTFEETIAIAWDAPIATPFCGDLFQNASHQPGSQFSPGVTQVIYEFTDGTNNKSVCTFNVTIIKDEIVIEASKAITPNGDGINDAWHLTNIERFKENTVLVVDRWGNRIFQGEGYDNTNIRWNGVGPNGNKVPIGTYFYTIEVRANDKIIRGSGFIEVIY